MELLIAQIEKNEIDINDIPMALLCSQYIEAIHGLPPDMEDMSGFLVMAATLLEIKSRMLLPRTAEPAEAEEDPREALVRQIMAYKHCRELAETLKNATNAGQWLFRDPEYPLMMQTVKYSPEDFLEEVSAAGLWDIFTDLIQRQHSKVDTLRQNFSTVSREQYTIADKILYISAYLSSGKGLRLSELFKGCGSRGECIVTFLALLEMIRRRQAEVRQTEVFAEIEVLPCPHQAYD